MPTIPTQRSPQQVPTPPDAPPQVSTTTLGTAQEAAGHHSAVNTFLLSPQRLQHQSHSATFTRCLPGDPGICQPVRPRGHPSATPPVGSVCCLATSLTSPGASHARLRTRGHCNSAFSKGFPLTGRDFGFQGTRSPLTGCPCCEPGLCMAPSPPPSCGWGGPGHTCHRAPCFGSCKLPFPGSPLHPDMSDAAGVSLRRRAPLSCKT